MAGSFDDYCDTELCLSPGGGRKFGNQSHSGSASKSLDQHSGKAPDLQKYQQQQRPLTIFYGGHISVCNVTETQARAIICMAAHAMEKNNINNNQSHKSQSSGNATGTSAGQLLNNPSSLSMKRSLQRFLQKRKTRTVESSPYNQQAGAEDY